MGEIKTGCVAREPALSIAWRLLALQIANALIDYRHYPPLLEGRRKTIESAIQFLKDAQAGLKRISWDWSDECRFQSDADLLVHYAFPNFSEEKKEEKLAALNKILSKLVQNPELSITKDEEKEVGDFFEKVASMGGSVTTCCGVFTVEWRLFELDYLLVKRYH